MSDKNQTSGTARDPTADRVAAPERLPVDSPEIRKAMDAAVEEIYNMAVEWRENSEQTNDPGTQEALDQQFRQEIQRVDSQYRSVAGITYPVQTGDPAAASNSTSNTTVKGSNGEDSSLQRDSH